MFTSTLPLPEATSYFWKHSRKETYSNWPFNESDKCNIDSMAAAGFYFIGNDKEPDLVECFICDKQLDGWESDDDPWNEHVKHQSDCPFVKLNKQNEKQWTVDELYDLYKLYKKKEYMNEVKKGINKLKGEAEHLMADISAYRITQK